MPVRLGPREPFNLSRRSLVRSRINYQPSLNTANSLAVWAVFSRQLTAMKAAVEGDKLYEAQTEIRHLKNTIQALRDELEAMRMGKNEAVQAAIAAAANEARQLQATIAALRAEMEQKVFQHADDLECQKHAAGDELRLLRETIAAVREKLEGEREKS